MAQKNLKPVPRRRQNYIVKPSQKMVKPQPNQKAGKTKEDPSGYYAHYLWLKKLGAISTKKLARWQARMPTQRLMIPKPKK